ncbi:uncharacterized protein LOC144436991 [Glandiceps talaboti]
MLMLPADMVPLTIRRSLPGRLALGRRNVREVFLASLVLGTVFLLYLGSFGPWTKSVVPKTILSNSVQAPKFQPTVVKIEWNDTKAVLHRVIHGIREADEFLRKMEKPQRPVNVTAETIQRAYDHSIKKDLLEGTLLRVLLTKQPLRIGVIGGSISEGNVLAGERYIYYNILADLLSRMLNRTVEIRNAIVPASDSRYYSFCLENHLNLQDVHIVLWELAVNDHLVDLRPYSQEELTRHVLMQPSQPQMIYVNFVNVINLWHRRCDTNEKAGSLQLSKHYNIPSISLTNATCVDIRKGWGYYLNAPDNYHPSRRAHNLMSIFITHLFRDALVNVAHNLLSTSQIRYIQQLNTAAMEATKLPPPLFELSRNIRPHCWSSVGDTPDDLIPVHYNGWEAETYINEDPGDMVKEVVRFVNKTVWSCQKANKRITFSIYIEPYEDYLSTVSIATIGCPGCGKAIFHVDNKIEATKTLYTRWKYWTRVMTQRIGTYITSGYHTLSIESLDNKPLTILAIMTAYDITARYKDLRLKLQEMRGSEESTPRSEVDGSYIENVEEGVASVGQEQEEDDFKMSEMEDEDEEMNREDDREMVKEEYEAYQEEVKEEEFENSEEEVEEELFENSEELEEEFDEDEQEVIEEVLEESEH